VTVGSKETCILTLTLIALTDLSIIFDIPVLRQILGFALLTFVPGFLLVQILRLTNKPLENLLFSIGLSVSFLMFIPLAMDLTYPIFGISRPISLVPLITTFSLILAVLSLVAYRKGTLGFRISQVDFRSLTDRIVSPPILGSALILTLGIFGALFLRFDLDSFFSLLSVLSIVLVVILIIISRNTSRRFYPLYIFVIAIALQYGRTLTSPNLFGVDAHYELYFAELVKLAGYWNPNYTILNVSYSDYFGMLSVTVLPNVYSILLNLDLVWVFKLVDPFIFAFVPVGLYEVYKTQTKLSNRCAFLATFLFMSFFAFFLAMPWVTRQEIAELFVVLILLLLANNYMQQQKKTALLILFVVSMAVSHYATSYMFLSYLAVLFIGSTLIVSKNRRKQGRSAITATMVVLAFIITFGWYLFASGGTPYSALLSVGGHSYSSLITQFISPSSDVFVQAGLGLGTSGLSVAHVLGRYWQVITEILITIGLGFVICGRKSQRMSTTFLIFSLASFFVLLIVIGVPSLGGAVNSYRVYAFVLLFLAPCCIFGVGAIVEIASRWLRADKNTAFKLGSAVLIVVLVPYFLFQSGFIFELTEHPANYDLLSWQTQSQRVLTYSDNQSWSYMAASPIPNEDVYASKWLSATMGPFPIYTDDSRRPEPIGYGLISPNSIVEFATWNVNDSLHLAYTYLGAANVQQNSIELKSPQGAITEQPLSTVPELTSANRIYSNGLAEVYYSA